MKWLVVAAVAGCAHPTIVRDTCSGAAWTSLTVQRANAGDTLEPLAHPLSPAFAGSLQLGPDATIATIAVIGAEPQLAATLRGVIATKVGDQFATAPIAADLRKLWSLGVLSDARVDLEGSSLLFAVTPQPLVDRVTIAGPARALELRRLRWLAGTPFEPQRITRIASAIQATYVREGNLDAHIDVRRTAHGPVGLCVAAVPGPRVVIGAIRFPGRRAVAEPELLAAMTSAKSGINTVGGIYDADALDVDRLRIEAAYYDRGMLAVRTGPIRTARVGERLAVEIPIHEGPLFRVRDVAIARNLAPIAVDLGIARGDIATRSRIRDAQRRLELAVGMDAMVIPLTHLDVDTGQIDITFEIDWRWPWDAVRFLRSH